MKNGELVDGKLFNGCQRIMGLFYVEEVLLQK